MKKLLSWLLLGFITLGLAAYFLFVAKIQLGGDIVEYYGTSESLLSHQSVDLSPDDQKVLEQFLHKAYFEDPGYYIEGKEGKRYPVHFVFYSFLVTLVRIVMKPFAAPELKSLWLVNIASFSVAMALIWKFFTKELWQRMVIALLWITSPLLFFFVWPGPDLWYLMVLSVAVFAYFNKSPLIASILTAIASWHSQPLLVLSSLFFAVHLFRNSTISYGKIRLNVAVKDILFGIIIAALLAIPYGYNL
ncbi:MAG: hypothetical protein QG639_338, partial [Patescibacteria group bacterium]|nr:hypothetical protein [Patescibacteria group bacterium]